MSRSATHKIPDYLPRNSVGGLVGQVGQFVHTLSARLAVELYAAANAADALVRLRAAQAACLQHGLLLHHEPHLGALPEAMLGCPLDPAAANSINRTVSTAAAAAATLDLIYPFERRYGSIRAMTSWQVNGLTANPGHLRTPHADIPIPVHGQPALRAHLGWLHATGNAEPDTPLFAGKPDPGELAEQVLRPLARLTDPRVRYRRSRAYLRGHATTWMHQRGLELSALADLVPREPPWLRGYRP